jgi:hypothetical protein
LARLAPYERPHQEGRRAEEQEAGHEEKVPSGSNRVSEEQDGLGQPDPFKDPDCGHHQQDDFQGHHDFPLGFLGFIYFLPNFLRIPIPVQCRAGGNAGTLVSIICRWQGLSSGAVAPKNRPEKGLLDVQGLDGSYLVKDELLE